MLLQSILKSVFRAKENFGVYHLKITNREGYIWVEGLKILTANHP